MSETDNFSHRAGYADDPLAVAMKFARKGGTLAAGEGLLLVQEIERLAARAERAEAVLAKLRPKDITDKLASVECDNGLDGATILAAVAAAEAEVGP